MTHVTPRPSPAKALAALYESLSGVRLLAGGDVGSQTDEVRERALSLIRDKLSIPSATRPLLVVVAGGTNVGKSTVCNLLVGRTVSTVSALARGTKSPVVCGEKQAVSGIMGHFLPGVRQVKAEGVVGLDQPVAPTAYFVATGFPPPGCLLIDSPDMDSDHVSNRAWALRLLDAADAVVLVVTPEKYHDAAVTDFLRRAAETNRGLAAVVNKSDSADALQDFIDSVWRPVAGQAPVVEIPRRQDLGPEIRPLRRVIGQWSDDADGIRTSAMNGSLRALRGEVQHLWELVSREQEWFADLHRSIDDSVDTAVEGYRRQMSSERFEELDRVFARLLREFRIPVVDDFYDGVRSLGSVVVKQIRALAGATEEGARAARRERTRSRVADACRALLVAISRSIDSAPSPLRHQAQGWLSLVPSCPPERPVIDAFLASAEQEVERWAASESDAIARSIGTRPGFRRFLVVVKSSLQIGAGVLGAALTGGIDVSDLAVIPVVERITAFLLERGLGYPYFVRCRSRLIEVRTASLKRFLDEVIRPVREVIPVPDLDMVQRLQDAVGRLPEAKELCS